MKKRLRPNQPTVSESNVARSPLYGLALVLLLAAWVYGPVRHFQFVDWDDEFYVSGNPTVLGGMSWNALRWAFTAHVPYWHPLTWISHLLDVEWFGPDPGAHHLVNVALHLLNTALVFRLLERATSRAWPALGVAALFAVHPLHVESVAWIAERKDLLSTSFVLIAIMLYVWHTRSPRWWVYGAMCVAFACSLMSKPTFVTLPAWLLLFDVWPLKRDGRPREWLLEKLPLVVMSAAVALATMIAQSNVGTMAGTERLPGSARVFNAIASYAAYLRKTLWPTDLAAFYPYPTTAMHPLTVTLELAAGIAISGAAIHLRRRHPYLLFGWSSYLVTLVPVIGFIQVGNQAMADRFTYVPLIGVFVAAIWAIAEGVAHRPRWAAVAAICVAAVVVMSAWTARAQVMTWADSQAMWAQVVRVNPNSFYAHSALGAALERKGEFQAAMREQQEALRLRPDDPDTRNEVGLLLAKGGDPRSAVQHFEAALRGRPNFDEAKRNLAQAHHDWGARLFDSGDMSGALREFTAAVVHDPTRAEFHVRLALSLLSAGRKPEATEHVRAAILLDPQNSRLRQWLVQIERP
jgi:Flp pilus assembly protein TadD